MYPFFSSRFLAGAGVAALAPVAASVIKAALARRNSRLD